MPAGTKVERSRPTTQPHPAGLEFCGGAVDANRTRAPCTGITGTRRGRSGPVRRAAAMRRSCLRSHVEGLEVYEDSLSFLLLHRNTEGVASVLFAADDERPAPQGRNQAHELSARVATVQCLGSAAGLSLHAGSARRTAVAGGDGGTRRANPGVAACVEEGRWGVSGGLTDPEYVYRQPRNSSRGLGPGRCGLGRPVRRLRVRRRSSVDPEAVRLWWPHVPRHDITGT